MQLGRHLAYSSGHLTSTSSIHSPETASFASDCRTLPSYHPMNLPRHVLSSLASAAGLAAGAGGERWGPDSNVSSYGRYAVQRSPLASRRKSTHTHTHSLSLSSLDHHRTNGPQTQGPAQWPMAGPGWAFFVRLHEERRGAEPDQPSASLVYAPGQSCKGSPPSTKGLISQFQYDATKSFPFRFVPTS